MKVPIILIALSIARVQSEGLFDIFKAPTNVISGAGDLLGGLFTNKPVDPCARDVLPEYSKAMSNFYHKLYTHVAARNNNHFVFSPYTIWLSLAGLSEGADPAIQSKVFASLNLPQESCIRRKFYDIALNVELPGPDVTLARRRTLVLDDHLTINPQWGRLMESYGLLSVGYAPIKNNPQETSINIQKYLSTKSTITVKGNSILIDSLDYHGLWTTAFDDASTQPQPFFSEAGEVLGNVNMMRLKKRVRLAQVPFMNAKVLELPVGTNGRYTMLFAIGTGNGLIRDAIQIFMGSILEIFSLLQMSVIPLDISIPKFELSSEYNLRPALEDINIRDFWINPAATKFVSTPPAAPGGLVQRVTISVDSHGVEPPPAVGGDILSGLVNLASNTATGVASAVGHQFIANRPFMFALFDTKTHTCLLAGAYSKPTLS